MRLGTTYFAAAICIGLAEYVFLALTYAYFPTSHLQVAIDLAALVVALMATILLDRTGHRAAAAVLLIISYVFLVIAGIHQAYARELITCQVMAHPLVLAVFIADRNVASGSSGRRAYAVAVVTGIAVGALMCAAVMKYVPGLFVGGTWDVEAFSPWFVALHPAYVGLSWLLFVGPAVLFYGERRLAARTEQRLRNAELERVRRAREMIESQLQAMQARVEPQFLFNTLAFVRQRCARDAGYAERMLDELVSFLRAAVPHLRETSSTLRQQGELVRAYLGILCMHLGNRLKFEVHIPELAGRARLPSMLLLPLVDDLVTHGLHSGVGESRLRITAAIQNRRLHIRVADLVGARADLAETVGSILLRDRLHALYGGTASLGVRTIRNEGVEAVLEIPFEVATPGSSGGAVQFSPGFCVS